jgi:D-alanine-D-alanine ligase
MKFKAAKVGVLLGGMSAEREVSFSSGRAVAEALRRKGYDVAEIDADETTPAKLTEAGVTVVYNALHGKFGEDGCMQGLCEVMRIPYTGPSVEASAMAMDKQVANEIFRTADLPVPDFQMVQKKEAGSFTVDNLKIDLPVIVKPTTEGSSIGISIVKQPDQLSAALAEAFAQDERVMIQSYVKGRELSVGVLDGEPLGVVEIRPKLEFYSYKAKYTKGMSEYLCPAPIDEQQAQVYLELARRADRVLGCEGFTRVDFILGEDGSANLLELNTLPGMTELSLLPMIAAERGISYDDLVEKILNGARLKMGN